MSYAAILPLPEIVIDPTIVVRAHAREETIEEYRERLLEGDAFPPIIVFLDRGAETPIFLLADGYHRLVAFQRAGRFQINCDVREGGRTEALLYALQANARHGIRRSAEDKAQCVLLALAEFPEDSDRSIAKKCAVSHPFVGKIRRPPLESVATVTADQLETFPVEPNPEEAPVETLPVEPPAFHVGQDGKRRRAPKARKESPALKFLKTGWKVAQAHERAAFMEWLEASDDRAALLEWAKNHAAEPWTTDAKSQDADAPPGTPAS